jgi:hypothetical protein
MQWSDYRVFDPGVDGPLNELPRRVARQAYDRLMDARAARIDELASLVGSNDIELRTDAAGIDRLEQWFRSEVTGDGAGRLEPMWYSVVNDIGLFLGEVAIERHPHLHWAFFDQGKRDVAYQRHVIMGFTNVANKKFNVDFDLLVAQYGHRVVSGLQVGDAEFNEWLRSAAQYA